FLPALPAEWKTGSFKGLCVRGGAVVDLKWKEGEVQDALLKATVGNTFKIKLPHNAKHPKFYINGILKSVKCGTNGLAEVTLKKNDTLALKYR
ncbi:MAG: glycoside hydrolase family 95-like protein, partial [Paludibacteraceae bacterium]